MSGQVTALAAASPRHKGTLFGRHTSGPCGGRKEGPQGRNESVNPLALRQRGTITKPLPWGTAAVVEERESYPGVQLQWDLAVGVTRFLPEAFTEHDHLVLHGPRSAEGLLIGHKHSLSMTLKYVMNYRKYCSRYFYSLQ